jgi:DNA invertase Pin-like site-specific DNA recombinase
MHPGELPGVRFTASLESLPQLRAYLGLHTIGEAQRVERAQRARQLRALGMPLSKISSELGVSLSTVKRDLREGVTEHLLNT